MGELFKRNCSSCGSEIEYQSKKAQQRGARDDAKCKKCYRINSDNECLVCGVGGFTSIQLTHHLKKHHSMSRYEYVVSEIFDGNLPQCKCGCGSTVRILTNPPYAVQYVSGHNTRDQPVPPRPNNSLIGNCEWCGGEFTFYKRKTEDKPDQKFCSPQCGCASRTDRSRKRRLKVCLICADEFSVHYSSQTTCSKVCAGKLMSRRTRTRTGYHNAQCSRCGVSYRNPNHKRNDARTYCSARCRRISEKIRSHTRCIQCDVEFNTIGRGMKFCSRKCMGANARRREHRICQTCGIEFEVQKSSVAKFCSRACSNNNRIPSTEIKVMKILENLGIPYDPQFVLPYGSSYRVYDFHLPDRNILLEVDGVYWHGKGLSFSNMNETQQSCSVNDRIKDELARNSGYEIRRIWGDEISEVSVRRVVSQKASQ